MWVADRHTGVMEAFDTATNARVNTIDLKSGASPDPAPDLMALAPAGNRLFVSLRGPSPLTGDPHVSTGSTPGLMVIWVEEAGRDDEIIGIVRVSNRDGAAVERADPHGIAVRCR